MSDQQNEHPQTTEVDVAPEGLNISRRKLVRAGLAAAPVVAAFKSNMVLAASSSSGNTTVRASSFASLATTGGSVSPNAKTTGAFLSMDTCKKDKKSGKLLFGPTQWVPTGKKGKLTETAGCGFNAIPSPEIAKQTLADLFSGAASTSTKRLAQYLAAGYMSAKKFGTDSYISEQRCKEIWENYGSWEPIAGVRWDMGQTLDYFERVYDGKAFSDCLINPAAGSRGRIC